MFLYVAFILSHLPKECKKKYLTAQTKCDIVYIQHTQYIQREGVKLEILIANNGTPIYQQIIDQTRQLILQGKLREGDALPSMRQLAKDLRISLITTKRAYEELETMGLLVTMAGKGCFVGGASPEKLAEEHRLLMEQGLTAAANEARLGGVTQQAFLEMASLLYGGQGEE